MPEKQSSILKAPYNGDPTNITAVHFCTKKSPLQSGLVIFHFDSLIF